jgi:hypothetical protein
VGAVALRPQNELFDLLSRYCKAIVTAHHQSPMTALTYEWRLAKFFLWLHGKGVDSIGAVTYVHFEDYMADAKWPLPQTAHKFACRRSQVRALVRGTSGPPEEPSRHHRRVRGQEADARGRRQVARRSANLR